MEFRVLGPLEMVHDGRSLAPSAAKDRAFLGELLAHPGQLVSTEHLADALWPDNPPADPANAVQVRASRLRAMLREVSGDADGAGVLRTRSGGYTLDLDQATTDLGRFETAVRHGEKAEAAEPDDEPPAAGAIAEALALWRGDPFSDVPHTSCVLLQAARAEELRLTAAESYADLCLAEGTLPASLVADLAEQAALNPLREPLHHRLIRALRLSGRSAEALAAYDRLRTTLADELGADPSPDLRRLHQEILAEERLHEPPSVPAPVNAPPGDATTEVETVNPVSTAPEGDRTPESPAEARDEAATENRPDGDRRRRRALIAAGAGLVLAAGVTGAAVVRIYEPPVVVVPDVLRPIPGDDSRLDADVTYPDGTEVKEGAKFDKVWRLANSGTVEWHDRYLERQLPWDGPDVCRSPRRVPIPDTRPGQSVLVRVPVEAPGTPVRCKVYWKMVDRNGIPYMPQLKGIFFDVTVIS
ncbi:hypothetical protein Pth03_09460 [Planotetraspora thailandica]|uniref:OmpR/PhoB-type domain-containing protein n=1 Tax=Planotetraspora thailandica TaxID=487172 RepID=A0A8J3UZ86_9ACTN|nr:BTAD domain-containing putative transcriptional regulator [Planotetraspora thailandica]GII52557.1 hypothetical protein Pth03_09460 [Planotetraspora thailandica]